MSISDNTPVDAATTNAALASKTSDNTLTGIQNLNNVSSGAQITNVQQKINDVSAKADANETGVANNASNIAINAGNIATNTSNISDNSSDISDLQTNKQDISEKGVANGYASLDGSARIPAAQLPTSVTEYKGAWDANTNSPALADGVGTNGDLYRVSVAGSQDLGSGSLTFGVGDAIIYNGTIWQKIPSNDLVTSVAGRVGDVVVVAADLADFNSTVNANTNVTGSVDAHSDVDLTGILDTQVLVWNNANSRFEPGTPSTVANLGDLTDVDIPSPNDGDVLSYNSGSGNWEATLAGGGNIRAAVIYEEEVNGSNGGSSTSGSYQTRVLNVIDEHGLTFASLSSNQVTLERGTYYIEGAAPCYRGQQNKIRFQNITDATTAVLGPTEFAANDTTHGDFTNTKIQGIFTITDTKVFELQHRVTNSVATQGYGRPASFGDSEIYTKITLIKIDSGAGSGIAAGVPGVLVRGESNGSTVIAANTTNIDFTEVSDSTNVWNGTQMIAPGDVRVNVQGVVNTTTSQTATLYFYVDGVQRQAVATYPTASMFYIIGGEIDLLSGEVLTIRSDTGFTLSASSAHYISISSVDFAATIDNTTDWTSYAPTFNGFGSPSNITAYYAKISPTTLAISVNFDSDTPTGVEARVGLPVIDATQATINSFVASNTMLGVAGRGVVTSNQNEVMGTGGQDYLTFSIKNSGSGGLANALATQIVGVSDSFGFTVLVPINTI